MKRTSELLTLLVLVIAYSEIIPVLCQDSETLWSEFKSRFGRRYLSSTSDSTKKQTFLKNMERFATLNADSSRGFQLGMNQFSDETLEEFLSKHTGLVKLDRQYYKISNPPSGLKKRSAVTTATYPNTLNLKNTGQVSAVKDQKTCGSCWAFAASEAVEGQSYKLFGKMISPSQQQLVDCTLTGKWTNYGCNGGNQVKAYFYMMNGIMNETTYPYTSSQGSCKADSSKYVVAVSQYILDSTGSYYTGYYTDDTYTLANFYSHYEVTDFGTGDAIPSVATRLIQVLNEVGPLAIMVCAYADFQSYRSGIYDNSSGCPDAGINHAVLLVGYNISSTNTSEQYWIFKNQWNTGWGMSGYMYARYGAGLIRYPSYPNINLTAFVSTTTASTTSTTTKPASTTTKSTTTSTTTKPATTTSSTTTTKPTTTTTKTTTTTTKTTTKPTTTTTKPTTTTTKTTTKPTTTTKKPTTTTKTTTTTRTTTKPITTTIKTTTTTKPATTSKTTTKPITTKSTSSSTTKRTSG